MGPPAVSAPGMVAANWFWAVAGIALLAVAVAAVAVGILVWLGQAATHRRRS
jgi:hypothetical protein